ncbi:MAG: hypothetical protein ACK4HV_07155 [Parachlamydiaceae bacterium]
MASITDVTTTVHINDFNKLREDVADLASAVERLNLEQSVLMRVLPNLVDLSASVKALKGRLKDLNTRVSGLEIIQSDVREIQKKVDAMGLILYAPKPLPPPSPAPGIYN